MTEELSDLSDSNNQITKATEIKELAEGAIEMEKQVSQQQVQNLTDLVEYSRNTTTQSVDDFTNRLKLDPNLFAEGQHICRSLHKVLQDVC